jgi:N-acyl-D-amino-acid deacylase
MMAASATEPDPSLVQLFIDKGADVSARDDSGRTALDWALLQGDTAAAQVLRKAGAVAFAPPSTPPVPASVPRTPRAAVEVALARLQPIGPRFVEGGKCISCHHQTLPSIAVALASVRGATVDTQLARHPDQATLSLWGPIRDELLLGRVSQIAIGGFVGTAGYALLGFAEEKTPSNLLTDALTVDLAAQQRPDGSWNVGDIRPPLFDTSAIHYTALAIRGLDTYMPAGRHVEAMSRIARGRQFLEQATPRHTQDEAFKLLGLVWSKASTTEISRQRDRVLELQRADGGWGQRPTMRPDAYQTGQVLYALYASGVPAASSAYQKGVQFLLRNQLEDGTWFVQSRAFAFQPYFETGFPHGTNQFVSAAATSWATIALTYAM